MSSRCYDPFLTVGTEEASWSAPSTGPGHVELAGAHPPGDTTGPAEAKAWGRKAGPGLSRLAGVLGLQESHRSQGRERVKARQGVRPSLLQPPPLNPSHLRPQLWLIFLAVSVTRALGERRNDWGLFAPQHIFSLRVE